MDIIARPLPPVCYPGRLLPEVGGIVNHSISAIYHNQIRPFDEDVVYNLLIDLNHSGMERGLVVPNSQEDRSYASAHYFIARDGTIYQWVDEKLEAWHAGRSSWHGREQLNKWTVGIEWAGAHPRLIKRYGLDPKLALFTDEQYAAGQWLNADIMSRHHVPLDCVVGHDQVAPGRKTDPGPYFDWRRLKEPLQNIVI